MILASVLLVPLVSAPPAEPALRYTFVDTDPAAPAPGVLPDEGGGFDFSYTYVELGYGFFDIDDFDDDSETLYGRASLGLFDFLFVFLDYQNQSTDFGDTDTDLFGVGAGAHLDLVDDVDLVGEAAWLTADVESDLSNLDDENDGWEAFAGARWMALPRGSGGLEVNGGFRWIDIEGVFSDDEIGAWEAGARYHFGKLLSVGTLYRFLEDDGFWGVDARLSF